MRAADVTLSPRALDACGRLGLTVTEVQRARAVNVSEREQPSWLVIYGELPDGRAIVMHCRHDRPWHVDGLGLAEGRP